MSDTILLGRGERILTESATQWRENLAQAPSQIQQRLTFMTPDHHRVRDLAVTELPRRGGKPLSAEEIATALALARERVNTILDELEAGLFFLVRNARDRVQWAFPVTVDPTAHRMRFSSGESVFAA